MVYIGVSGDLNLPMSTQGYKKIAVSYATKTTLQYVTKAILFDYVRSFTIITLYINCFRL